MQQPIREKPDQLTWLDYQLEDLRLLDREFRAASLHEVEAAPDIDAAIEVVARCFGLGDSQVLATSIDTPSGAVQIQRESLYHIVEKRRDARERYAHYALDTLTGPFEVWRVAYDNDSFRLAFIGVYETKNQMLVVVNIQAGHVLWNFMHSEAKSLNKHRHGELLYQRYSRLPSA